jgi:ComF family protein
MEGVVGIRSMLQAALRALLPAQCALCGGGCDGVVCDACGDAYAGKRVARCACCANPMPPPSVPSSMPSPMSDAVCGACLRAPPAYDATVAAVDYAAPLDQLVLRLKFGACLPLAPWCARQVRDAVLAHPGLPLPDLLCPVPLGAARLRERGFNQALEIARPLAAALGVALAPQLALRTLDTPAQSGVAPRERARNVRGAFALHDPDLVAGRHVGLVDDVMTSGHTLAELAAVCKRFGAARVTNFVFARTPPHA